MLLRVFFFYMYLFVYICVHTHMRMCITVLSITLSRVTPCWLVTPAGQQEGLTCVITDSRVHSLSSSIQPGVPFLSVSPVPGLQACAIMPYSPFYFFILDDLILYYILISLFCFGI